MKATYNERPQALELMPDGYTKYRFEIKEVTREEKLSYECREVIIHGAVTSQKVIEAVMAEKWSNGVEQKLINDYNEFILIGDNLEAETKYKEFLIERKIVKNEIKVLLD